MGGGQGVDGLMLVQPAELGAAVQGRHVLAGVEQPGSVEGSLHRMEEGQLARLELGAHGVDLLATHPMFAGDGAPHRHAQIEDAPAQGLGLLQFAGAIGIEEDQRMQVAVAGMEDVAHRQAVFRRQGLDTAQDFGQGATRDGAVHAVVVGRQPPHGGKGVLAPGPEFLPLGLVAGQADLGGTGGGQQGADALDIGGHVGLHPVQFAEQDGRGVHRVAGVDEVLGGSQGQVVHHLQATGDDAGGDDVGHRRPGAFDVGEAGHHHPGTGRLG